MADLSVMSEQARASYKKKKRRDNGKTAGLIILFTILAVLIIIPIYVLFIASFKPGDDFVAYGLNLNPEFGKWSLVNYDLLFNGDHNYWIWFKNSIILTVITVVLTLLVSAFVAYGFAAYEFKGRNFLFMIVLGIMSVPFEVIMLPLYQQMSDWQLMDTYFAIVIPFLANASTIFFFRQYLLGMPKSLIEAGRIDGATEYGIFFKLIIPIMKPAFAAMAILNGMNAWNNYMWPLLVIRSEDKYTLTLGLNTLLNPYGNNYSLLIVGSCFSIIPIFILFIAFQKYFIEGMTAGAVKG